MVIGAAFTGIVNSFVADMLTPLIAAIGGEPDFSALQFTINNSAIMYGNFLNALISFLIIATTIYFGVVKPTNVLMVRAKRGEIKEPETRNCTECLSSIPLKARRCPQCTAVLKPAK